ncbi:MAG: N-acetylmuramoyl-L-alanine amidase [Akkermansia sp.]|nr:N-acetylmuramoyl-L-alanine amidase [Akkermansia sp.]MDO4953849.1 N-acetylmuramoyl-L-alanine amidase [Akkermansia sp.]
MRKFFLLMAALVALAMLPSCVQQRLRAQARESQVVVLDIGHYYHPQRGGQGARTPDARYGNIEECEFWYKYAIHTKRVIEQAGYTCRICNRGAAPANPALAAYGRRAGVHQINTPEVTGVYRSKYHPERMAVGILSADYGIDQKPGCIVFLHHNSNSDHWQVYNKGAIYCNECGTRLASAMAQEITRSIYARGMNNNGVPCGVIIRNNGHRGGGDWLNTCNEHCVPAAITEAAFLSNPDHAKFLGNDANAVRYAQAIGRGIVKFMQSR